MVLTVQSSLGKPHLSHALSISAPQSSRLRRDDLRLDNRNTDSMTRTTKRRAAPVKAEKAKKFFTVPLRAMKLRVSKETAAHFPSGWVDFPLWY